MNLPGQNSKELRPETLLEILQAEMSGGISNGIYHKLQVEFTYNSNHIEGSCLTAEQTRYIFETNTIGLLEYPLNVDDILETANHFRCIDEVIKQAGEPLTEQFAKKLQQILKTGTADSRRDWFAVGAYKQLPNEVGGRPTTPPEQVAEEMRRLLQAYEAVPKNMKSLLDFHVRFERIHPFQDGNGRVGRLLLLKECLKYDIVPFIISDDIKLFYYRGLQEWDNEPGFLLDTCLSMQDRFKAYLDYFRIKYAD